MTEHYHGTPITPRGGLYTVPGHSFCVSYADPRDVTVCHQIGERVMLDNGAWTFFCRTGPGNLGSSMYWDGFMDWAEPWLDHPNTWAVIPDIIDGSEEANDHLLVRWFQRRLPKGVPVWHMHESLERLQRLAHGYGKVCIGSSGRYAIIGTEQWHQRMAKAFNVLADDAGRVPWVHMLRGMALCGGPYPFASVDSANGARNHHRDGSSLHQMLDDMDAVQCPARWTAVEQLTLEAS